MINLVKKHLSTDQTRYHLTGCYFPAEKPVAVATDGHRMIVVNTDCFESVRTGLTPVRNANLGFIYDFDAHTRIDGKYPNYEQILPRLDTPGMNTMAYTFPDWFKGVKSKKCSPIFLTVSGFQLFKPDATTPHVALNIAYLAPYAGCETTMYWRDSLSPVTIKCDIGTKQDETLWTAIVMPMRA